MNLEETLDKIAELSQEELGIVRSRGEERTAFRHSTFLDSPQAQRRVHHEQCLAAIRICPLDVHETGSVAITERERSRDYQAADLAG